MIVEATIEDSNLLTNIALTSKSYWGYTKEQLEIWRDDLTITSKIIQQMMVYKFITDQRTAGFYALNPPKGNSIELEMLFVLPEFIGQGIGKQLLQHSFEKSQDLKASSITLLADPNAVNFYKSQGFIIIDQKESAIPNRFLPMMQKDLTQ